MSFSKEELYHLAKLSKIEIKEEKIDEITQKISDIVDFANALENIDIDGIKPTAHILDIQNVLRKDSVEESFNREVILKNAPAVQGGCISVPKVVE